MTQTFEIYFHDLTVDSQIALCEAFKTVEEVENWDEVPIAVIEREVEDIDPAAKPTLDKTLKWLMSERLDKAR